MDVGDAGLGLSQAQSFSKKRAYATGVISLTFQSI